MPQPIRKSGQYFLTNNDNNNFLSNNWKMLFKWIKSNFFLLCVILGAVLGVCLGSILRLNFEPNANVLILVGFPGELFMRTFKMLLLPLVVSSITTASSTLNAKTSGKMAVVTLAYFLISSFTSATIGLLMVTVIHPGNTDGTVINSDRNGQNDGSQLLDTIMDLIRNMLPENIIQACLQQVQTIYTPEDVKNAMMTIVSNGTTTTTLNNNSHFVLNETFVQMKRTLIYRNQANFLGLIVFFFVFGTVLGILGEKGKPLANIFAILDSAILIIVAKFTWFTPIGVASLICEKVFSLPQLDQLVAQLGAYFVTVVITLVIHIFIFIPLVYFVISRRNPFRFLTNVFQALFAAFATDSSAIALPLTLHCMEEKLRVDRRITRFVLPLGVTVNMNGTAAFLALASVFLAQMKGIEPTFGEQVSVLFCATLTSVATVAAPSASLFLLGVVVTVIPGVGIEGIAILFAFDWLLSRCRAISNVLGDCCGAVVVQHFCRKNLKEIQLEEPMESIRLSKTYENDDHHHHHHHREVETLEY